MYPILQILHFVAHTGKSHGKACNGQPLHLRVTSDNLQAHLLFPLKQRPFESVLVPKKIFLPLKYGAGLTIQTNTNSIFEIYLKSVTLEKRIRFLLRYFQGVNIFVRSNRVSQIPTILQKQLSRSVLRKRCSENMYQIYRRTPMPKCDFNKVACNGMGVIL